jgi:hypothetical protein
MKVAQIVDDVDEFGLVRGTQGVALFYHNVLHGDNQVALADTYSVEDRSKLFALQEQLVG